MQWTENPRANWSQTASLYRGPCRKVELLLDILVDARSNPALLGHPAIGKSIYLPGLFV